MKKTVFVLIAALLTITIFSCNPKNNNSSANSEKSSSTSATEQTQTTTNNQNSQDQSQYGNPNEFSYPELGFAIWFPEKPQYKTDTITDAGYKVPFHTFVYQGDDFVYMVAVGQYPSEALADQVPDSVLVNVMIGFANSQGLHVESQEKTSVQGANALLYKGYSGDTYVVIENVINGTTVYQIIMAQKGEYPDQQAIHDFIGSFKLLNKN